MNAWEREVQALRQEREEHMAYFTARLAANDYDPDCPEQQALRRKVRAVLAFLRRLDRRENWTVQGERDVHD